MAVEIRIPTPLRRFTGDRAAVALEGATLEALIAALVAEYPALKPQLMDEQGKVRNYVNLFLNGEDVRGLGGLAAPVKDGDKVSIVPAVAGGAELSREEIQSYSRHLIMPEVPIEGW